MAPQASGPMAMDLDDYGVDDPFALTDEENAVKDSSQSKKRTADASGLGIDEEVDVARKVRAPRLKLDENRLLSEKGITSLRRKAGQLKFKGKGHEFSDAAGLLSFYQLWLDDLFPKAKFLDALAMVEKAGHSRAMQMRRTEWIKEGKPDAHVFEDRADDQQPEEQRQPAKSPARVAPIFQNQASQRQKTPEAQVPPFEDIYDATPITKRRTEAASTSLFGHGGEPTQDELDALVAEEEAERGATASLFGNGEDARKKQPQGRQDDVDGDVDDDELGTSPMAAAESESREKRNKTPATKAIGEDGEDDMDDLDALMAEMEPSRPEMPTPSVAKQNHQALPEGNDGVGADEEEAMAEMDGLW